MLSAILNLELVGLSDSEAPHTADPYLGYVTLSRETREL